MDINGKPLDGETLLRGAIQPGKKPKNGKKRSVWVVEEKKPKSGKKPPKFKNIDIFTIYEDLLTLPGGKGTDSSEFLPKRGIKKG